MSYKMTGGIQPGPVTSVVGRGSSSHNFDTFANSTEDLSPHQSARLLSSNSRGDASSIESGYEADVSDNGGNGANHIRLDTPLRRGFQRGGALKAVSCSDPLEYLRNAIEPLQLRSELSDSFGNTENAIDMVLRATYDTPEHVGRLVEAGVCPHLIQLLDSKDNKIIFGALNALTNIASMGTQYRDLLVECGIVNYMFPLARRKSHPELLVMVASCLRTLLHEDYPPLLPAVTRLCMPAIESLLRHKSPLVAIHVCNALWSIAMKGGDIMQDFQNRIVIETLVNIVRNSNCTGLVNSALRALLNIIRNNPSLTSKLDVLYATNRVIMHADDRTTFDMVTAISILRQIVNQGEVGIQALLDADLLPMLRRCINHNDPRVRDEIIQLIDGYVTRANSSQVNRMFSARMLMPLIERSRAHDSNDVFRTIANLLRKQKRSYG